jgi:cysteine synthase
MKIQDVQGLIGNTPVVFLEKYKGAEIWLKLEGYNLTGSLKDRTAQRLVSELEKSKKLARGMRILGPSSGSFAVALAMQACLHGYDATVVVNSKISGGNLKILERLGTEIIRYGKVSRESMEYCEQLMREHPGMYAYADQLNDPAAVQAHYDTTAPEILRDMPTVSAVVASMGSGATLLGVSSFFRDNGKSNIKVIASIAVPGDRKKITGTYSPGVDYETPFIKTLHSEKLLAVEIPVLFDTSKKFLMELAKRGFFVGQQTGGVYDAARQAIDTLNLSGPIVLISGDTGFKWLPPDLESVRLLRIKARMLKPFQSLLAPMRVVPDRKTD